MLRISIKRHGKFEIHTFTDLINMGNGRILIDKCQYEGSGKKYYEALLVRFEKESDAEHFCDNLLKNGHESLYNKVTRNIRGIYTLYKTMIFTRYYNDKFDIGQQRLEAIDFPWWLDEDFKADKYDDEGNILNGD